MLKSTDNKLKLILFLLAFMLYANTIKHDYAWDDSIVITENPRVQRGFSGIPSLFLKYNSQYRADKYGYRPIVLTSFAIEYGLFKNTPQVSHFMNVLYFALLCIVIFTVLRKLLFKLTNLAPFLITLLFLVHPVHVEAVANIKSRDEIFALLFSLLSLSYFIDYHQQRSFKQLALTFLFFLLAFLSKESAITFLAIMPLSLLLLEPDYSFKKYIKPLSALAVLLAISFFIVKFYTSSELGVKASQGSGVYYEGGLLGNSFFYTAVLSTKLANALTVLVIYLRNFFFPVNLVYFYGYNQIPVASWGDMLVIVSLALHVALLLFALLRFKKYPQISYGILFYLISISIYTHLFRTLSDTMADRFLFTPSLGLCLATVCSLAVVFKINLQQENLHTFINTKGGKNSGNTNIAKYVLVLMLVLLAGKTFTRNKVWKNDATLVLHDMPYLENCARAHNYYADQLKIKLRNNFDAQTEANMIAHYRKSFGITHEAYYAYLGLSTYYSGAKRYNEALALLDTMLQLFPGQADPHFYSGEVLYNTGEFSQAINHLTTSLKLAPEVLSTYFTLAQAYARVKEFDKALETITIARNKFGDSSQILEALSLIYFEKGDLELSTKNSLEMIKYGADAQLVYKIVIGRYQYKKQDSLANVYYQQARSLGLLK